MTRLRHGWLVLSTLPILLFSQHWRTRLLEMLAFCRGLPTALDGPLPEALVRLTQAAKDNPDGYKRSAQESLVRRMSDVAALLDRRSKLGLCLRRSLTRYYYLRAIGVPVVLQFGAKFLDGRPDRAVSGHSWLTLQGRPYFEAGENYQGFSVMFCFPSQTDAAGKGE